MSVTFNVDLSEFYRAVRSVHLALNDSLLDVASRNIIFRSREGKLEVAGVSDLIRLSTFIEGASVLPDLTSDAKLELENPLGVNIKELLRLLETLNSTKGFSVDCVRLTFTDVFLCLTVSATKDEVGQDWFWELPLQKIRADFLQFLHLTDTVHYLSVPTADLRRDVLEVESRLSDSGVMGNVHIYPDYLAVLQPSYKLLIKNRYASLSLARTLWLHKSNALSNNGEDVGAMDISDVAYRIKSEVVVPAARSVDSISESFIHIDGIGDNTFVPAVKLDYICGFGKYLKMPRRAFTFIKSFLSSSSTSIEDTIGLGITQGMLHLKTSSISASIREVKAGNVDLSSLSAFDNSLGFAIDRVALADALRMFELTGDSVDLSVDFSDNEVGGGLVVTQKKVKLKQVLPLEFKKGSCTLSFNLGIDVLRSLIYDLSGIAVLYVYFTGCSREGFANVYFLDKTRSWFSFLTVKLSSGGLAAVSK